MLDSPFAFLLSLAIQPRLPSGVGVTDACRKKYGAVVRHGVLRPFNIPFLQSCFALWACLRAKGGTNGRYS